MVRTDLELGFEQDGPAVLAEYQRMTRILKHKTADAARRWCFATGRMPHPNLAAAFELTLESLLGAESPDSATEPDLAPAMAQLNQFLAQFQTPGDLLEAVGLGRWTPFVQDLTLPRVEPLIPPGSAAEADAAASGC